MIMKRILVVCSFLLMFFPVFSQDNEKLSIEDAVVGLYTKYYPDILVIYNGDQIVIILLLPRKMHLNNSNQVLKVVKHC